MHELREATSAKAKSRFIGTLAYAAPEQVRGDEVTVRTDVYSTGQVLWEMFAMRAMFHKGLTPEQLVAAKLKGDVPRLRKVNPTVPPPLEEVVMAALSLNPADRQQSAGELSQLFTRIVRNTSMNAGDFTAQQALLAPDPAPLRASAVPLVVPPLSVREREARGQYRLPSPQDGQDSPRRAGRPRCGPLERVGHRRSAGRRAFSEHAFRGRAATGYRPHGGFVDAGRVMGAGTGRAI